ncbi:MAG: sigma-54 dependent transcriptional regulator [Blastocatellia bacterium]|nr:sigma-54 dependent transcriptional regulator [Blastocatellia bacterium]
MATRILFVGSDSSVRNELDQAAAEQQWQVTLAALAEEAIELLSRTFFDAMIATAELPGMTVFDLLAQCRQRGQSSMAMIVTNAGSVETAVKAMKHGATDVFTGPVSRGAIREAIRSTASRVPGRGSGGGGGEEITSELVARSARLRRLLEQVVAIAPFNATVLVTGESGTGKELIARAVHEYSQRRQRPFVALNCAAIPDQLLEDELFGHVKGAFTGAVNSRDGRFDLANGGTLFLDEIGDMSLPLQAKLLRVLQEREFEKLGSSRSIKVDVRIIAATSADLEQKIKNGTFRLDLYYRLNVMHLRLPPLRERPEDLRPLADRLLARFCDSAGLPPKRLSEPVAAALAAYHWPGNVRQLQNAMERAAALSGAATIIELADLPEEIRADASPIDAARLLPQSLPPEGVCLDAVVTNIERELLLRSLSQTGGNKMQAAKLLRMKRTTFVEKLKRLQIEELSETMMSGLPPEADGFGV